MDTLIQDIRYGVRVLWKGRGVTLVAIIALALGIGANTAIFSIVNALLFRGLPYKNADRIVTIWETNADVHIGFDLLPVSVAAFDDWRKEGESFDAVSMLDSAPYAFTGGGAPERVAGVSTSASFFDVMGVEPILGRTYTPDEDQPGSRDVVVVSYALWRARFGGDPEICGKTMQLDGKGYTIIGVMPRGFQFPRAQDLPGYLEFAPEAELWTPIRLTSKDLANRDSHSKAVIARLRPGIALARAQSEIDAITSHAAAQYPAAQGFGARVVSLKEQLVGELRVALLVLLGAVGVVLLIACANVANLLLARAAGRQKEIAIRAALGARRGRLVRQLLTESVLLSIAGGAAAVALAIWGLDLLVAISPASIPRKHEIAVDGAALAFTFSVSLITGVLFGLAPAFQVSRCNLNETLKEGSRGSTAGHNRLRSSLVVVEVALSVMLLIGAGLLIRSFARLTNTNPGFDPRNVAAMELSVSTQSFTSDASQAVFFKQVLDKAKAIPGVASVGSISALPLSGAEELDAYMVEGEAPPKTISESNIGDFRFIDDGYFRTMAIPLIAGREFSEHDDRESAPVVIISQSLARRHFADADPLGKRISGSIDPKDPWATVVGVAGDVKNTSLDAEVRPQLYFPYQQRTWGHVVIVARSRTDAASLFGPLREAVWAVNKDQPITKLRTVEDYLSTSVSQHRFNTVLLGAFALLALILAGVGIYGVMSYSITQRTHEMGIRMALGAKQRHVLGMVIGEGMKLAGAGVGIGIGGAFAVTRVMASLLFGVSATDPLTFVAIPAVLTLVALAACYAPARRATRVDPMAALREE